MVQGHLNSLICADVPLRNCSLTVSYDRKVVMPALLIIVYVCTALLVPLGVIKDNDNKMLMLGRNRAKKVVETVCFLAVFTIPAIVTGVVV